MTSKEKRCIGGYASGIEDNCVVIEKTKLSFHGELEDCKCALLTINRISEIGIPVDSIRQKLQTVRRIESGVEVVGTNLAVFDLLDHVEDIRNPDGYALEFRNNKKLNKIRMNELRVLDGKQEDVLFESDHFIEEIHGNSESLSDFLHLESVARASHKNEECSPEFVKIITSEASEYGWDLYALIVSCAVLAVIVTVQTFYLLKGKGKIRKNKMRSKGRKKHNKARGNSERCEKDEE
ncbi:hypothetical protein CRE_04947 [Caenorhabditis remanei]|uniref:Uncharacterized protein n=1 Tax=Caenorhabditis remanei TaxID=31234 RepID=E3MN50_CAERE|nr:hypothetical protein CRE_04947 [Caenorhabditis remanei]